MQSRNRNKSRTKKSAGSKGKNEGKPKVRPKKGMSIYSILSMVVLLVAVSLGIFWSKRSPVYEIPVHSFLASFVCKDILGYCHNALVPTKRTQKATRYIRPGELVLVIPRHLQIWDLDAMRNVFIQSLMGARHADTDNPLDSGAYLATYLARRLQNNETSNDSMLEYLNVLPSYKDLTAFHPVLWSESELAELLGRHSSAYAVTMGYRDMVESEYKAFTFVSSNFANLVSKKDYQTMRIHVMSRSFGPGPPGPEEAQAEMSLEQEMESYKTRAGVDLSKGCRAMVPILDMYDHHARPNVEWRYQSERRAFVIYASSQGIAPGQEIMDSYGRYTDAHLFAKFGFVNGDGSGYTQASIAMLHTMLDADMKQQFSYMPTKGITDEKRARQKRDMIRYLQLDDGYTECIQESHVDAYELKRLKLEHLLAIANNPDRWILRMPPRDVHSLPASSATIPITTEPPKFDHRNLKFDGSKLISTCRLITLTEDDFDGDAIVVLRDVLNNKTADTFMVGRQSDELEFRALSCLARLSGIALSRYTSTVAQETELVSKLTQEAFQSRNWTAAHVRLGEMQTLELLHGISMSGVRQLGKSLSKLDKVPTIRKKPCPFEFSKSLIA